MSRLDRLTDDHLESIVEAIGALTDVVQKAGLKVSIQHQAILLGFVRLIYPPESLSLGERKRFDVADGERLLDIADGTPCGISAEPQSAEGPVCKFGPGGDYVREWPATSKGDTAPERE